jgi:hypothetical protein
MGQRGRTILLNHRKARLRAVEFSLRRQCTANKRSPSNQGTGVCEAGAGRLRGAVCNILIALN